MKKLLVLFLILAGCSLGQSIEKSGGLRVIMSINPQEVVRSMSLSDLRTPSFEEALQLASVRQETSTENYIDLFVEEYRKLDKETPLSVFFSTYERRDYITPKSSDSKVISVLKGELEKATSNSFNIIRSRISRFGISSANIQLLEKPGHILVELPGIKEPERVLKLLQSTSNLEFWETYSYDEIILLLAAVNDYLASAGEDNSLFSLLQPSGTEGPVIGYAYEKDIERLNKYFSMPEVKEILPRNLVFKWSANSVNDESPFFGLYAIKITNRYQEAPINGEVIVDAKTGNGEYGTPVITMMMSSEGTKMWARLTRENIGEFIAIVIDDRVFSAPMIMDEITGGRAQISGPFTMAEARDLTILLKSGRMPCSLTIVKEEMVLPVN